MDNFLESHPLSKEEQALSLLCGLTDEELCVESAARVLSKRMSQSEVEETLSNKYIQNFIRGDWDTINEMTMFDDNVNVLVFPQLRYSRTLFHKHSYFELIYVSHGCCEDIFVDHRLKMTAGDLHVIPPDCVHKLDSVLSDCLVYNLLVRTSTFLDTFSDLLTVEDELSALFLGGLREVGTASPPLLFKTGENPAIGQLVENMARRSLDESRHSKRINENYFRLFVSLVMEASDHDGGVWQIYPTSKLSVLSVFRYIYKNYADATLEGAARHLGYSENYVSKLVKRDTGKSFKRQLADVRMTRAAWLMENTQLSSGEIMESVGIGDLSYFYKAFKRYHGKTPAEYRRERGEKQN